MKTNYKLWYIKRDDDNFITEVAVRFYEGEIEDSKFVAKKRLESFDELKHLARSVKGIPSIKGLNESNGKTCVLYHKEEFGNINTEEEVFIFLNTEISKDTKRSPILEIINNK